ncbi:MAG TPA: glycosyltransferase, partial [Caballeronia sp.]|nr:glycosyltransferase [Caballeronia sp.]
MTVSTSSRAGTLMVMAGGTGGHVFPGLAVAHWMQARGWR